MRQLTSKQKRLIIEYIDETRINHDDYDREETSHTNELEQINDTEILWQEANRFGNDYIFSDTHDENGKIKFKKEHLHKNFKRKRKERKERK